MDERGSEESGETKSGEAGASIASGAQGEPVALGATSPWKEWLKLLGVTAVWFLLTRYLVRFGGPYMPDAWKAMMSFQAFQMICQALTLAVGLGLSFTLLARPRAALGLARPKGLHLAAAALLAPAAFVLTAYLALQIAMPTLLAELATRGPGASRQNAGELGRQLTQAPLLAVILWGAVLAAVGEELLFRGAFWSLVERLGASAIPRRAPAEPVMDFMQPSFLARLTRDLGPGLAASVASAVLFGQMHADMPGGVGLVRVASTTILGFTCGIGRLLTGTIWVSILLHVINNTLTIGSSRRWFVSTSRPIIEGLPNPVVLAAGAGLVVATLVLLARGARSARARKR